MRLRRDRWAAPPRGGKPPTEPVEPIDLYPNPFLPPAPPLTREEKLARVATGFASLDEAELRVALLWLTGVMFDDIWLISSWRRMRFGGSGSRCVASCGMG